VLIKDVPKRRHVLGHTTAAVRDWVASRLRDACSRSYSALQITTVAFEDGASELRYHSVARRLVYRPSTAAGRRCWCPL